MPEESGIAVALNEHVVWDRMDEDVGYFEPPPEWNESEVWGRQWN